MLDENNLEDYDEFERADKFIDDQIIFNIEPNRCVNCGAVIDENEDTCDECE